MAHGNFKDLLQKGGFRAFLWTQFLGGFNVSVYLSLSALHVGQLKGGAYVPLVAVIFVLPSLFFCGWSGHLADCASKRTVLIGVKIFELFIMLIGLAALVSDSLPGMLLVVCFMGLHAAISSPAKYGIVPEMLPDGDLSRGNALLAMSTFVAIVLGTAPGGLLVGNGPEGAWRIGAGTLAVSIAGLLASVGITRVPPAGARGPLRRNPFGEIADTTRRLLRDRLLWLAVLGVAFAGVLLATGLLFFGNEVLLWVILATGIGCGNLLAGKLSGDRVELGLIPIGSLGIGIFAVVLYAARGSLAASAVAVALLAVASGVFVLPQYAFMQQRAGAQEKGRTIATSNFIQSLGIILASLLLAVFHDRLHASAATILFVFALTMLAVTAYLLACVPECMARFILWTASHTLFRIRALGAENVPLHGPALLVSNHMSHIDGVLINAYIDRRVRFMMWKPYFELKAMNWFLRRVDAIPVSDRPREMVESIRATRKVLADGHVVCIFAEGAVTRTGNLLPFKRGMEKIVHGLDVPIVPVHIDRMWGSIFSFAGGRFFWKRPKRIPYPVTVSFGAPLPPTATTHEVRHAIQELAANAIPHRKTAADTLDARFVRNARGHWNRFAMADSTRRELTYGSALVAATMIARQLPAEPVVGVLLPASVDGALANLAITLAGRVAVNLNFTAGAETMTRAAADCGVRVVITSRTFAADAPTLPDLAILYLEDLVAAAGRLARVRGYVSARFAPRRPRATPDSVAAVVFSSGSTGTPKAVALTHYNLLANIEAMAQLFPITPADRVAGVLPFFHPFDFTLTLWFPLVAGCGVVYHPNPADARGAGDLVESYRATLLLSTPTFCANYTHKVSSEQFASLRYVLIAGEKLHNAVATAFREKFGLTLLEGYGCAEMGPVIAVNSPGFEWGKYTQVGAKPGTVGQPLPGVAALVVDAATFEPLPANTEGLLLVKGASRMAGYLNQPERTAEVLRDGWYVTGDIAALDDDGFLRITDRLSRFSRIAGEIAPHIRIEEAFGDVPCAVTAIADDRRGERLVALYAHADLAPLDIWRRLSESGLPPLWIPERENIYRVDALPRLGTGKLDLRALQLEAERLAGIPA